MKKVIIIQKIVPHYREPIFNKLAEIYDLTICAEKFESQEKSKYNKKKIEFRKTGPFISIKKFDSLNLSNFDIVIFSFNIRWINLIIELFKSKKKYKLILWGIGVASEKGFDNSSKFDFIRYWCAKKADSIVFYDKYPLNKYIKSGGISKDKMYVAHNTLDLPAKIFTDEKKFYLFVGTLKKYKKIDKLVEIYNTAYLIEKNIPKLHIIGDGDYMQALKSQINSLTLSEKIILHGSINDTEVLETFYKKAIACISPNQAGLTVLQSLSMGVPFICNEDAITGGEKFNIIDGYNGFLIKSDKDFASLLITLGKDKEKVKELNLNANKYFKEKCSVENMLSGFTSAVNYTN